MAKQLTSNQLKFIFIYEAVKSKPTAATATIKQRLGGEEDSSSS